MHIFKDSPENQAVPALLSTYVPYPFALLQGEGERVQDDAGREDLDFYGGHCGAAG